MSKRKRYPRDETNGFRKVMPFGNNGSHVILPGKLQGRWIQWRVMSADVREVDE